MKALSQHTLRRVKDYNIEYQKENGCSPSFRTIMNELKLGSLATVRRYVLELEKQGQLKRSPIGSIEPLPQYQKGGVTYAPLIGSIACGLPNTAIEEYEETYALPKSIFGDGELFLLHATGNSMIDIGITPGDLLVLKRQECADDGDIVVALIDGEATLKRLYHRGNKIVLHPENKRMQDIVVEYCDVQGVLVSCIKRY